VTETKGLASAPEDSEERWRGRRVVTAAYLSAGLASLFVCELA